MSVFKVFLVQVLENMHQKNSNYGHFSRSDFLREYRKSFLVNFAKFLRTPLVASSGNITFLWEMFIPRVLEFFIPLKLIIHSLKNVLPFWFTIYIYTQKHRRSRYFKTGGSKDWRYGLVSPAGPTMVGAKGTRKFWK